MTDLGDRVRQLDPKTQPALLEMGAPDLAETVQDLWQVLLTSRPRGDTVPWEWRHC